MEALWNKFQSLFSLIQGAHEYRKMSHGHGFDHAFAVANLAALFCEASEDREFAWMAGLCHNADRMIALDRGTPRREVPDEDVNGLVYEWLSVIEHIGKYQIDWDFEKVSIINAVLNHGKPNDSGDDTITRALKDADRVVNARLDVVIRSAQFQPELPVIDLALGLDDKRGKYNGRLTVVADLMDCLDWGNLEDARFGVRTAGAKKMIVERVALLKQFLEMIVEQRREEGLVPYPILSE